MIKRLGGHLLRALAAMSLASLWICGTEAMAQEAVARFAVAEGAEGGAQAGAQAGAQGAQGAQRLGPKIQLLVRSTTDLSIFAPALEGFVTAHPEIAVNYEQWGSNALYANSRAACAGDLPAADAVISSGVHQMVDLVNRACASPYRSDLTAQLPAQRIWRDELWGITREAAVIIYNRNLVPADEAPMSRFALLDLMRRPTAEYRGKIATYDIEASGLGFLFAFMDSQQATTFGGLLEGFARVGAVATCCSAEIIARVESGDYKIAYNVLGSYVDTVPHDAIGVIYPEDYTMYLSRGLMIPKQARQPGAAALFLDFLLSPEGRAILAKSALIQAGDKDETTRSSSTERYIPIDPTLLVAMDRDRRQRFIDKWRNSFGAVVQP